MARAIRKSHAGRYNLFCAASQRASERARGKKKDMKLSMVMAVLRNVMISQKRCVCARGYTRPVSPSLSRLKERDVYGMRDDCLYMRLTGELAFFEKLINVTVIEISRCGVFASKRAKEGESTGWIYLYNISDVPHGCINS